MLNEVELLVRGCRPEVLTIIGEIVFFLLTSTLVTFGMTLVLSREGAERYEGMKQRARRDQPAGGD